MKNKFLFLILLLVLLVKQTAICQPRIGQELIDSLLAQLPNVKADTVKTKMLITISNVYWQIDPQKSVHYGKRALELAKRLNSIKLQATSYSLIGTALNYLGQFDSAIYYHQQSLYKYRQLNHTLGIASAFNNLGITFNDKGIPDSAIKYYTESMRIREVLNDTFGISASLLNIANVYYNRGDLDTALILYNRSYKIKKEIDDVENMLSCLLNIGNVYNDKGDYETALKYYYEGLKYCEPGQNILTEEKFLDNIGFIYREMKQYDKSLTWLNRQFDLASSNSDSLSIARALASLGQTYARQGNYDKALEHYQKSLSIYEKFDTKMNIGDLLNSMVEIFIHKKMFRPALQLCLKTTRFYYDEQDKLGMANANLNLGKIYFELAQNDSAAYYLSKGLALSRLAGKKEFISTATEMLSFVYRQKGDYKKSLEYYMQFTAVKDSMFNEANIKALHDLNTRYDTEKKEQQITLLNKDKKIQQTEISRQKLIRNGFISGFAVVLLFAVVFFRQRNKIKKGKKRSDELLLNILPSEVAEELKAKGSADAKSYDDVTVMFTDFKNFTQISEKLSPAELVAEIHTCFKAFDNIITRYNIEKIKTIGDAYMCAGGLPVANTTNATDVVKAAIEIRNFMTQRQSEILNQKFEIRIGVHTGPVVAGIVGVKKFAYDIWGDTVNIASRMESSGEAGKVNISGSTYELVKDKFKCERRGKIQAKNKGEIDMYFVEQPV